LDIEVRARRRIANVNVLKLVNHLSSIEAVVDLVKVVDRHGAWLGRDIRLDPAKYPGSAAADGRHCVAAWPSSVRLFWKFRNTGCMPV
jgi:hypothetical protein